MGLKLPMNWIYRILIFLIVFFADSITQEAEAQTIWDNVGRVQLDGQEVEYYMLKNALNYDSIPHYSFESSKPGILNFGQSSKPLLLKFRLTNKSKNELIAIFLPVPYIDTLIVFDSIPFNNYSFSISGSSVNPKSIKFKDPYPGALIQLDSDSSRDIYIYIKSTKQYILPLQYASKESFDISTNFRNIFYGGFVGIMLCMFLYNIVLAFYTKDRNYLYYIFYIVGITLAQISFLGISFYIFRNPQLYTDQLLFVGSSTAGVFGALFAISFLKIKQYLKLIYWFFVGVILLYIVVFLLFTFGFPQVSYQFIQVAGLLGAVFSIYASIKLSLKGIRSAKIYLIAWSLLILGLIAYAIKDFGIIPTTNFSNFSFPIGVAIETILLSIALADQINTLKKDNEKAQERIIEEMSRNENLIKDQNIILEEKVKTRTEELEHTLNNLKKAQVKLVESEKMASLGVLTSGIAHEINNPINYVSANVVPLRENILALTELINSYKELTPENFEEKSKEIVLKEKEIELEYTLNETSELIDGIEEGAKRTYNIVDGLRTFSRSDTTAKRRANINKGIESTLSVLKSQIKAVTLQLELDSEMPLVNCQLGKLNQVFLNLVNNALHAIEEKFPDNLKSGVLTIKSYHDENTAFIQVADNGSGIPEESKTKIFEPFFTSKPVGKGTGLGLSISYSIIEDHKGNLTFESETGVGTTFTISLPIEDSPYPQ